MSDTNLNGDHFECHECKGWEERYDALKRVGASFIKANTELREENLKLHKYIQNVTGWEIDKLEQRLHAFERANTELRTKNKELEGKMKYIPFGYYLCRGCNGVFRDKDSHTCTQETLSE